MRKVFIADAHLRKSRDFNYRTLLNFLKGLQGNTETLYILGDLFEFWVGYRTIPFTHYLPVLETLRDIHSSGTHIVYFEGNHDFHMGPFFEKTLEAEVYHGPRVVTIERKKVYLCHGDEIIHNDYGHKVLRFLLHNPFTKALIPLVPYRITSMIADTMSRHSACSHGERNRRWDYVTILKTFAAKKFESGCDVVVAAHFHTPYMDVTSSENGAKEKILLSLGDWKTQFSYGEWGNNSIELKTYPA